MRVTDGANPVDAALVVRLAGVDDTAPALTGASVDGAALTLTYGEALDGGSTPPVSAFAVNVGGSARTVEAVSVAGSTAVLTLSPAVTAEETVTVGYTVPSGANAKPLQDTAGNRVATFAGAGATNATGASALPAVSIAASSTPVSEGTAAAFTLTRTGDTAAALAVTLAVTESGAMLDGAPPVSATFAAGSASAELSVATLDDEAAEDASTVTAALSADAAYTVDASAGSADIVVEDDDAAPVVGTASPIVVAENATDIAALAATDEDTDAADLAWSIPEGEAGGADAAQFALTAGGALSFRAAKDFEAPDDADADGDYEVTVRVTDGANPVDAALVVRLTDADDTAPALTGASVDGAALTLTFGEALDGGSTPPASAFAVNVGGSARTVEAVSVAGSTAVLTLSPAVTSGQTVTVGYTVPAGENEAALRDAGGNRVAAFAGAEATNATAAALPAVSIAPASTPVTEGASASFTLTRTGDTGEALTVSVSVSQAGSVLAGSPPSSATFAAEASTTRLIVATANDAVDEADARVRASLVSGDGYTVDSGNASAGVDVFDNDAAPEGEAVVETLWSTVLIWADLGNDWYGGFDDAFSDPGWSEDGQAFRISYIAYDAGRASSGWCMTARAAPSASRASSPCMWAGSPSVPARRCRALRGPVSGSSATSTSRGRSARRWRCASRAPRSRRQPRRPAGSLGGGCAGERVVGGAAALPGDARRGGAIHRLGALPHVERHGACGRGLCGGVRRGALLAGADVEDGRGPGTGGQPRRRRRDDDADAVGALRGGAGRCHGDGHHLQHRRDAAGVDRAVRAHGGGPGHRRGAGPDARRAQPGRR